MVRLVFRPYTQLRRSICTSESLRSSIRVSPDFNLARHSSPSFGSERMHSGSSARSEVDAKGRDCALGGSSLSCENSLCFHCAFEFNKLNDSCICSTPWSVFQDGSEVPPTYSQQRCQPRQEIARYTSRLCYPSAPEPGKRGSRTSRELHPHLGPAPTVRCVNAGRNTATEAKFKRTESLRISGAREQTTEA